MKKIGIITLFGYHNYGNRLQMFAVQSVFKKMGYDSEIIRFQLPQSKESFSIQLKIAIHYLLNVQSNLLITYLKYCRTLSLKKHAKFHYRESEKYINPLSIDHQFHQDYSFISVGSDQIWGWFTHSISEFVFLKFAPKEKRITFSPSFGSSSIEEKYFEKFKKGLKGFSHLSVREPSGQKLIDHLTSKSATVLCDPTFCLSKKEWENFSTRHPKKPSKKFILTYFLGSPPPKVNQILHHFSHEFEAVNLNSLESRKYYAINPSEWVDYINSASLFLTDSFHGVAFAIMMQTPFSVYERVGGETMHTRITAILEKFKMESRFDLSLNCTSLFELDFTNTQEVINSETDKVDDFLKKSMR